MHSLIHSWDTWDVRIVLEEASTFRLASCSIVTLGLGVLEPDRTWLIGEEMFGFVSSQLLKGRRVRCRRKQD